MNILGLSNLDIPDVDVSLGVPSDDVVGLAR
jgi:hypothetical protein